MHSKASRMGRPPMGDTPANVGPSTYDLQECKDQLDNYAPFLSCTPRGFSIGNVQYTNATYDTDLRCRKIKVSVVFLSTDNN